MPTFSFGVGSTYDNERVEKIVTFNENKKMFRPFELASVHEIQEKKIYRLYEKLLSINHKL